MQSTTFDPARRCLVVRGFGYALPVELLRSLIHDGVIEASEPRPWFFGQKLVITLAEDGSPEELLRTLAGSLAKHGYRDASKPWRHPGKVNIRKALTEIGAAFRHAAWQQSFHCGAHC